ncbi:MAG: PD-(D/E)XK nuclease family protein [Candidatus Aminicenantales bacterium]
MGTTYSFSRMECFKNCRLQYRFQYLDGLPSEIETIEAFMGSRVHEALKKFYDFIKNQVVQPKEWLLAAYEELWQKNFNESVKVVKSEYSAEDYYHKGKKCLSDYYEEYHPFDQAKIVKTEEPISFLIKDQEFEYAFKGVLDRLDWNDRERMFEIHDYKTSSTLITQEEADRNVQLPLYQLALQSRWPEARKARLVWHYLLFNKQIESSRTDAELETLQQEAIARIKEIEACAEFPPTKSALCDWCGYQVICPLWKHPKQMEKLELNAYREDPGVVLVAKYANLEKQKLELKEKILEIEQEQGQIEEAAIAFAEKENLRVIDGPDNQLVVTIKEEEAAPTRRENEEKWQKLRDFLIHENRFIEVSTINNNMLNSRIRAWPGDIRDKIRNFLVQRKIRKVDLRKKF